MNGFEGHSCGIAFHHHTPVEATNNNNLEVNVLLTQVLALISAIIHNYAIIIVVHVAFNQKV